MIKHEIRWQVGSPFHPAISLVPELRKRVNNEFLTPILKTFFQGLRIREFNVLDIDKIKTEIEFVDVDHAEDFVKSYVYQEIFDDVHKVSHDNKVQHCTKCIITFDRSLTPEKSSSEYPGTIENIEWGAIRLGDAPILYYIWIDLQRMIDFIKRIKLSSDRKSEDQDKQTTRKREIDRSQNFQSAISDVLVRLYEGPQGEYTNKQIKDLQKLRSNPESLQGKQGALRINLSWYTLDDLDLHLTYLPTGQEISYKKKRIVINDLFGILDVDANAGQSLTANPQENIYFEPNAPEGEYLLVLDFFNSRDRAEVDYTINVVATDRSGAVFTGKILKSERNKRVAKFRFSYHEGVETLERY